MRRRSTPEVTRRRRRCTHHWVIETPDGRTSKGHCRRCGSVRRFRSAEPAMKPGYMRRLKGSS